MSEKRTPCETMARLIDRVVSRCPPGEERLRRLTDTVTNIVDRNAQQAIDWLALKIVLGEINGIKPNRFHLQPTTRDRLQAEDARLAAKFGRQGPPLSARFRELVVLSSANEFREGSEPTPA